MILHVAHPRCHLISHPPFLRFRLWLRRSRPAVETLKRRPWPSLSPSSKTRTARPPSSPKRSRRHRLPGTRLLLHRPSLRPTPRWVKKQTDQLPLLFIHSAAVSPKACCCSVRFVDAQWRSILLRCCAGWRSRLGDELCDRTSCGLWRLRICRSGECRSSSLF